MVWALLPLAVLVALVAGARLSHNWPVPPERWAPGAVLAVQILLASLLVPQLVIRWSSALAAVAIAGVALALAFAVAEGEWRAMLTAWGWLALWLVGIGRLFAGLAQRHRRRVGLNALPATLAAGLAVLVYVAAETGSGWSAGWLLPRPLGELGIWPSTSLHWVGWLLPAGVLGAGIFLHVFSRRRG